MREVPSAGELNPPGKKAPAQMMAESELPREAHPRLRSSLWPRAFPLLIRALWPSQPPQLPSSPAPRGEGLKEGGGWNE